MRKAFTLGEIMIVVAIIGIILIIVIFSFLRARETSRATAYQGNLRQIESTKDPRENSATACQGNLKQIESAKEQWALENKQPSNADCTFASIVGSTLYIKTTPVCPSGGTYTVNAVNADPTCSIGVNANNPSWSHVLLRAN